jgi:hypothetical protein
MGDDPSEMFSTANRCGEPFFRCSDSEYRLMLSTQIGIRADLFISAKTSTAIPARHPLVLDALVQTTLDPQVRALEFIPTATVGTSPVALKAIVVVRDDGRFHLDVVEARPVRNIETEGLALLALDRLGLIPLTLTAADIKREPRFGNSRLVWSYKLHPVGIGLRMRVLQVLLDDGPMTLARLLSSIRSERDPSPAIMAMACSSLIELDLVSQPLGPLTIARSLS